MTRGDRLVVIAVAVAVVVSAPVVSLAGVRNADSVGVDSPTGHTALSLAHDGRYEIQGRCGTVVLDVTDRAVRCIRADCPDQLCVRSGVARPGHPIVCAPNGVSVSLGAKDGGALDAVTR